MKKYIYSAAILIILIFMFTNPGDAVDASKTGVILWSETIIPTLLPFMVLSNLIIQLDIVHMITYFFWPICNKIFGLSSYGTYAFIIGFLCGYPMGAKVAADLVQKQYISRVEGQYLLNFCNNVSPMFVITYIIINSLQKTELLIPTLVIIYGSPIICAILLNYGYRKKLGFTETSHKKGASKVQISFELVDTCIMDAFENVTKLGGYIILFALISKIISHIPLHNLFIKNLLMGVAEITYGIQTIAKSNLVFANKYLLIIGITTFGGLSSLAQTESMIKKSNLSLTKYIGAKLLTATISIALGVLLLF